MFHIADAHCDTLTKYSETPYHSPDAHWNLEKFQAVKGDFQIFAIFTPPERHGDSATAFAAKHCGLFSRTYQSAGVVPVLKGKDLNKGGVKIMLSLEGAAPIQNDISYLHAFYDMGVRAMGLTWNHRNHVADGIDNDYGLTVFGREVIQEMERMRMIIDVSHLNIAGFKDVCETVGQPFIASHSNARKLRNHKRNLEDWQIKEIISRGGFIGLNFYTEFVDGVNISESANTKQARENSINALIRHAEHILKLGGEEVLGFGADFDGIKDGTYGDVLGYPDLIERLRIELGLSDLELEKIAHLNLKRAIGQILG
jgi:membrane dipeptidase